MDAVRVASVKDLCRRLRSAGDQHHDLRCMLLHGVNFPPNYTIRKFGEFFGYSIFAPLTDSKDSWKCGYYRKSSARRHLPTGDEFSAWRNELRESSMPILHQIELLLNDAEWLATSLGLDKIPGTDGIDTKRLHPGRTTWVWLLFHTAWSCPAGTILRAGRRFPSSWMAEATLHENQLRELGFHDKPRTFENVMAAKKAIAERNRAMSTEEQSAEWCVLLDQFCAEAKDRVAAGEYVSVLPVDPFTASAALLELMVPDIQPKGYVQKASKPKKKQLTANMVMLQKLQEDSDACGWSSRKWAAEIGYGKSTIQATETWGTLRKLHEKAKAEKAMDNNHSVRFGRRTRVDT